MKTILVTGCAGFIGYHLAMRLTLEGYKVIGIDNINDYYDLELKYARLNELGFEKEEISEDSITSSRKFDNLFFKKIDINNIIKLNELIEIFQIDLVSNLAAQAGVRYSLENPKVYMESNISGTLNLLEFCKTNNIKKYLFASSSSVYGKLNQGSFAENLNTDHPASLYAASKKASEVISYTYSDLYSIKCVGIRFFTVYGPWGRPDMAPFLFTKAIIQGDPIKVFNAGKLTRDFTYIDDIVEGLIRIISSFFNSQSDINSSKSFKIYNIGNSKPVELLDFIKLIESIINIKAKIQMKEMQLGDVYDTWADTTLLENEFAYKPQTNLKDGLEKFINWYKMFYKIQEKI